MALLFWGLYSEVLMEGSSKEKRVKQRARLPWKALPGEGEQEVSWINQFFRLVSESYEKS